MIPNYYMYGDFFDFEGLIFKTGKRVTLEKHSPIKQFNEPADKFYYVRSGLVRAVVLHSDGNEKALYVAGSGCLLPQFSPHGMPKWEENLLMEAYTDVEAILLTRSELEELAGRSWKKCWMLPSAFSIPLLPKCFHRCTMTAWFEYASCCIFISQTDI